MSGPQNTAEAADVPQGTSAERILSTALDLFAVKGYDATSVREICEAAGITKPTLYHFFGSKDGVLQALVEPGFCSSARWWMRRSRRPGRFRQRVKVLARSVFESASRKPLFWRFMHSIIWAPPGTALPQTESCTQFYDGVVGVLADAADEAVERGEIAPGPTGGSHADPDGCDQRGGDRIRDCRQARADARAGGRNGRHDY